MYLYNIDNLVMKEKWLNNYIYIVFKINQHIGYGSKQLLL